MFTNLLIGILASIIAGVIMGLATYKLVVKNRNKNTGIIQEKGSNQIALMKSKNNSISIGVTSDEKERKSDKPN